jgi:hypothetical protein
LAQSAPQVNSRHFSGGFTGRGGALGRGRPGGWTDKGTPPSEPPDIRLTTKGIFLFGDIHLY